MANNSHLYTIHVNKSKDESMKLPYIFRKIYFTLPLHLIYTWLIICIKIVIN